LLKTVFFDIQAKASEADVAGYNKLGLEGKQKVAHLLLQSLLEDRFQLKARVEARDLPVYALVVAKGGIKMKEVQMDPIPPFGVPPAPGAHLPRITRTGSNEVTASAWPMNGMAEWLSRNYEVGNRPVVNETGLTGSYDFVLRVSLSPPPTDGSSGDPAVSLFTALPEQLGLKLVPEKALTEVLVIDHIERPSPN
jgi:bla regulator protein BlaR1